MAAWVLPALAGASLFSSFMGGRSASKAAKRQQDFMERQWQFQKGLIDKYEGFAEPFRESLYPQVLKILSGETDLSSLPAYRAARLPLEDQYANAKRMIEAGPRGGGLERALAELEGRRARSVGEIPGRLYDSYLNAGLGLASGKPELAAQVSTNIGNQAGGMFDTFMNQAGGFANMGMAGGQQMGMQLYNQLLKGPTGAPASVPSYPLTMPGMERFFPGMNLSTAYGGAA